MSIFLFYLNCDARSTIGDPEVNQIRFRSTTLAGLSNVQNVSILKIGPVVSDIGERGGALYTPSPQSVVLWKMPGPQSGAGLTGKLFIVI